MAERKRWILENGVLSSMTWDFMVYGFSNSGIESMEKIQTKYLKKWLNITKSTDAIILYRREKGLGIKYVTNVCLTSQVNKDVILSCSRDKTVRRVAAERRAKEIETKRTDMWCPAQTLTTAVQKVSHDNMFTHQKTELLSWTRTR